MNGFLRNSKEINYHIYGNRHIYSKRLGKNLWSSNVIKRVFKLKVKKNLMYIHGKPTHLSIKKIFLTFIKSKYKPRFFCFD